MPVLMKTGTNGTSMITCINPKAEDYDETLSILANSSMAHEIREIPKIGRVVGPGGGSSQLPAPLLQNGSSRGSVLMGDKSKLRSSALIEKFPNSSKKRDASCLSRKFSQESIDTLISSAVGLGSESGDGSVDYKLQINLLNEKILQLEQENALIQMDQLEKERLIREDVCNEMAERSATLLEQIRELQDELYSLKNYQHDHHKSVKKAKRMHDLVIRDLVTNDLHETEEEMEIIKFNYEKEIKSLKTEVRNLKAELIDWRKKAESAMKIISQLKEKGHYDTSNTSLQQTSTTTPMTNTTTSINNENDEHHNIIAETFDERMQRDQRFNKHKKLVELSPKMKELNTSAATSATTSSKREPLSTVSPNASPIDQENVSSQIIPSDSSSTSKFSQKVLNSLGRSPPPSPHRSSDALPIAPPQSDIKLNSAPFVPNRILRSQMRMA